MEECGKGCNNDRISEYHESTIGGAASEETAWCSAFVNWCMEQAGIDGTNSKGSQSWTKWKNGFIIDEPAVGAIAVFIDNGSTSKGHVAFVAGMCGDVIVYLGGNQGDAVGYHFGGFNKKTLRGYFFPIGYEPCYDLPYIDKKNTNQNNNTR